MEHLGDQAKKKIQTFNHLTKLQADISLLQETHLSQSDHDKLTSLQFNQIFSANYNKKQRGVAILISNKVSFTHNSAIADQEGRFIIINISINSNPSLLAVFTAQILINHPFSKISFPPSPPTATARS